MTRVSQPNMIRDEHRGNGYDSMRRIGAVFVLLGAGMIALGAAARGQNVPSLGAVRAIAVGSLGANEGSREFTRALAGQVRHDKSLQVTTAAQADATLEGDGALWIRGYHSLSPRARENDAYAEPIYGGYLSVVLKAKDGEVLWSYFANSKNARSRSEVEKDLARDVLDTLAEAIRNAGAAAPSAISAGRTPPTTLRAGGATFPFPIYERWFTSFHETDPAITITYDPSGSTAGVARFSAGQFDFAGSDIPVLFLKPQRQSIAFPTVIGGVVLAYNLPKFSGDLRLTPELAARILAGKITRWNDAALRALNPGSSLPDQPIQVIHRGDGSGTTFALTHFLSETVPEWKDSLGEGDRVAWPVGQGAAGNDGVSALLASTPYSFGYTEFIYAFRRQLNIASIRNAAGRFVQPDLAALAAAAEAKMDAIPPDFDISLTNAPGRDAYPISTFTWLVVPQHEADASKREALKHLLEWALGPAQRQVMGLGYVPLPKRLLDQELRAVAALN